MGAKIYLLLNWLYWQPYLFTLYAVDESVRDPINHLGSILYHSEPSDFFCCFLQQDGSGLIQILLLFSLKLQN